MTLIKLGLANVLGGLISAPWPVTAQKVCLLVMAVLLVVSAIQDIFGEQDQ